jgi:predicted lipoprotein
VNPATTTSERPAGRRWLTPRVVGVALAVLVVGAMALDTTYRKDVHKTTASGGQAFDPARYAKETFPKAATALAKDAVPLPTLLAALRKDQAGASRRYGRHQGNSPYAFATKGEGVAGRPENGLLPVRLQGVPQGTRVSVQIGPALNGTSIRDAVGFIRFGQFVNQVDYADAATALNNQVKAKVLKSLDAKRLKGRRLQFLGAFTLITPTVVTITPVRLEATR